MGNVRLTIDGRPVVVEGGETVLEAARSAGIFIPTICDHKDLTPYGACRMCIVEIEGIRGFPTSCTTPAADGMVVKTQTEELVTLRRRILELMLSGHPNSCLSAKIANCASSTVPGRARRGEPRAVAFAATGRNAPFATWHSMPDPGILNSPPFIQPTTWNATIPSWTGITTSVFCAGDARGSARRSTANPQ